MKLSRTVDVYYHIAGVHMGKLDCPKCHKRMSSFDTFRKHIDYCHPADNFKEPIDWTCPICSQNQGDYYEFREHLMTAHLAGIQEVVNWAVTLEVFIIILFNSRLGAVLLPTIWFLIVKTVSLNILCRRI